MEMLKIPAGASATIVAALIAAAVTFLVSVFTKESKTSEFRQAWIEALRNDLAQFVGVWWHLVNELGRGSNSPDVLDGADFWERLKPEILKLEELQIRIELRLNPAEHVRLVGQIRALGGAHEFIGQSFNARKAAIDRLTTESQRVLKSEWRRVKRGEPVYRWVKWLSLTALAIGALVLCMAFISIDAATALTDRMVHLIQGH